MSNVSELGLTEEELSLIPKLVQNLKDVIPEHISNASSEEQQLYYVRWLRARDNNLDKATDMLRNHFKWRIEVNANDALEFKIHPFFSENYPFSMLDAVDKEGRPILCAPFSKWDFRIVTNNPERLAEFDNFVINAMEKVSHRVRMVNRNRPKGHPPITQATYLLDCKDFPYGQLLRYSALKRIIFIGNCYEGCVSVSQSHRFPNTMFPTANSIENLSPAQRI